MVMAAAAEQQPDDDAGPACDQEGKQQVKHLRSPALRMYPQHGIRYFG
jgi:hypothetical protein